MSTTAERRPITLRTIAALQPGEEYWDSLVKGFYVRRQRDARVYVLKARIAGRTRHITIGKHGSPWTPEQARKEAKRLQGEVAGGKDPATQREKSKATLTVADIAKRFLREHCGVEELDGRFQAKPGASIRPSTARGYRDTLRDHVLPDLGKFRCDAITTADAAKLHFDLRDKPRAANYALSVLIVMINWAMTRHLWPKGSNPTDDIKRYQEARRTKALNTKETERFVSALAQAEKDGRITLYSAAALRFLLLCGLRPREALAIKWTDIDFETGRVHLPATKTGPGDAMLSEHALALLKSVARTKGNPYVFCGHKLGQPLASLQHAFELVRAEAKLPPEVVLYTLRHNFGSTLADSRVEAYELMKMMGHKNLSTSLRYIHLRDAGIQATSTRATAGIAAALSEGRKNPVRGDEI